MQTRGYAATAADTPLAPFAFERRTPGDRDVHVTIDFCGICHSDIHQVREEWGGAKFPMVPGHEMVGRVVATGASVTRFKTGDLAGVGCMVDACRSCAACKRGLEQFCELNELLRVIHAALALMPVSVSDTATSG